MRACVERRTIICKRDKANERKINRQIYSVIVVIADATRALFILKHLFRISTVPHLSLCGGNRNTREHMACAHLYTDYRDFDAVYVRALCECVCRQCDVINRSLSILQIHRIRQRDARYSTLIVHICVRQIYRIVSTKWIRRNRRKENFMKTNLVCRGNEQKEHNNEMIEDEVCSSEQIRRNTIRRTRNEECEMNVYVPKDKSIKLFCLHVNVRSTYSGCSCCSERSCYNRWMDIVDWRCMIELSWLLCVCIKLTKVFRHQLLHS